MTEQEVTRCEALTALCADVKILVQTEDYDRCRSLICRAMGEYPDAPQPHNLLGLVLEKTGNHVSAMKHFRAAWALDPTYAPANQNLTTYGTFYSAGGEAWDEGDCRRKQATGTMEYDSRGVGRLVRRK